MKAIQLITLAKEIIAADSEERVCRLMARCPDELQGLLASNIQQIRLSPVFTQAAKVAKSSPSMKHAPNRRRAKPCPVKPQRPPVSQERAFAQCARLRETILGQAHA